MPTSPVRSRRQAAVVVAVGAVLTASGLAGLAPPGAVGSSHREAPHILGLPQYDTTDVYAFVSPDRTGSVTLIANWVPFEEPAGGPNFYPFATDARNDINIDNDGDANPDVVYRWTFRNSREPSPRDSFTGNGTFLYNNGPVTSLNDENLLFRQTYRLQRIDHDGTRTLLDRAPVAPSFVGRASMPDYAGLRNAAITTFGKNKAKSFAGQADDPFFLDLRVFDLLYGGDLSEVGDDTLAGFNVNTIALQVPSAELRHRDDQRASDKDDDGDPVIGVWSTTSKRGASGRWVQVSRLGNPLVNEVVIPYQKKDRFNASQPRNDAQFAQFVTEPELPEIIEAIYRIPAPATPRNDLVAVFLTGVAGLNQPEDVRPSEQLRLNLNRFEGQTFSRLGVIGGDNNGYPNGRRLADDVVDISLQVVEGELVGNPNDLGDAVNRNDRRFGGRFPYVALPHSGSDPRPHAAGASGFTPLTGGRAPDAPASPGGVPVAPLSAVGVGLLVLLAGVASLWRRTAVPAATA